MCDWQVYGDVPDESASVAVAGYRPTKTVEMELHFDRVFGDWMLYDAVNMKGEAAHLIMFSAYGRKPRRYDFPDDLSAATVRPFNSVKVQLTGARKTSCIYGHVVLNVTTSMLTAVVFNIASGGIAEVALEKVARAEKDDQTESSQSASAALGFEV